MQHLRDSHTHTAARVSARIVGGRCGEGGRGTIKPDEKQRRKSE